MSLADVTVRQINYSDDLSLEERVSYHHGKPGKYGKGLKTIGIFVEKQTLGNIWKSHLKFFHCLLNDGKQTIVEKQWQVSTKPWKFRVSIN